ncbi:unnamed protein product, partial [Prorocentrum cordatum]
RSPSFRASPGSPRVGVGAAASAPAHRVVTTPQPPTPRAALSPADAPRRILAACQQASLVHHGSAQFRSFSSSPGLVTTVVAPPRGAAAPAARMCCPTPPAGCRFVAVGAPPPSVVASHLAAQAAAQHAAAHRRAA